jgi:hypothetical protein
MIRKCIVALVAISALAIVPAATQAKVKLVHIGRSCEIASGLLTPPAICGIKGQEKIIGDAGQLSSTTRLGFRVSKKVGVRLSITAPPTILGSSVFLEKRFKLLATGSLVGSFIDAGKTGACVVAPQPVGPGASQVCHTEKFNLRPGTYALSISLDSGVIPSPGQVPFSLTMTATSPGRVFPYVNHLDGKE